MPRKSQIFKIITVIVVIGLFIILLGNIFNSGQSFYYIDVEMEQQMEHQQKQQQQRAQHQQQFTELWPKKMDIKLDLHPREPLTFEVVTEMEKKIRSLPLEYFYRHANKIMQKFKNCAQYPAIQVLNFYNTYWQTFHIDNSIYQLYAAYYDARPENGPVIRILAMSNKPQNIFPTVYCQLWLKDDNRPVLTTVREYKLIWDTNWGIKPDVYYPYLMTCDIPKNINVTGDPIPQAVNLVKYQCDTAKNSLRIIYEKPETGNKKQQFAVCVKGLDFLYEDLSARLVEWLELLKILGVHKVFMHRLQVHSNISKVLDYYRTKGFVEVQDITLVGGVVAQPALQHWLIKGYPLNRRLNELITYNDCFYRNMYKYDYIALLDIDEIIMPKDKLKSWQHLLGYTESIMKRENNCPPNLTTFCATNVYFPNKIPDQQLSSGINPSYMYMLNHAYRYEDYTTAHYYVKCLHNTQQVLTLHNHYPLAYLNRNCTAVDLFTFTAQLQHYRSETKEEDVGVAHKLIKDKNLYRFRQPLIESCTRVLKDLKFLN